jgi:uridine kinase
LRHEVDDRERNTMSNTTTSTKPSATVQIFLESGEILEGPRGASIEIFLKNSPLWHDENPIVGAIINGRLRELTYHIELEARVKQVRMSDSDGALIYRRSLTFLMAAAFEALYPDDNLVIDHSVVSGGYYCRAQNREDISEEEVHLLEQKMRAYVAADLPFEKRQVPLAEAIAHFESRGQSEKVQLLNYRQKSHLILYKMADHQDYHHGYMLPSSGYLKTFGLVKVRNGFILRYPRRSSPTKLQEMTTSLVLLGTFAQYYEWLSRLKVEDVGALNTSIASKRIRELVLVAEALHEQRIASIAQRIVENQSEINLVLIAGPSSSGKTTTSKRLTVQMIAQGLTPYTLALDNYFVNREETPKDENGEYDFESLYAVNIPRLNEDLMKMVRGERVQLPRYNFLTGLSEDGEIVQLRDGQVIIMEGIHGLNPNLLPGFSSEKAFRIYVSCLTQLNLDRYNRISTTDTRLIRRIVRDARERGYSATDTIRRWDMVRKGEKKHIFPYQNNADEIFNSALVYELSAVKNLAEPLLRQVSTKSVEYIEANRLLSMLEWFLPMDIDMIPDNSILREFIGGSILHNFDPRYL